MCLLVSPPSFQHEQQQQQQEQQPASVVRHLIEHIESNGSSLTPQQTRSPRVRSNSSSNNNCNAATTTPITACPTINGNHLPNVAPCAASSARAAAAGHPMTSPTMTSNGSYSTLPSLKHHRTSLKQTTANGQQATTDTKDDESCMVRLVGVNGTTTTTTTTATATNVANGITNSNSSNNTNHMNFLNANSDVLANLVKLYGVSKRNALMKWCQERVAAYKGVEIKNFSSCWNDGFAFCALIHSFLPDKFDYDALRRDNNPVEFCAPFLIRLLNISSCNSCV